ncbi:hypothetical protein AB0P15_30915 [Streptomyces sp. NPDC087917]|uniref:hypothetical protein n=1 Tax=Streptomyces sp. NPDC087917 TaxID=3155060 RepID=UPI003413F49C
MLTGIGGAGLLHDPLLGLQPAPARLRPDPSGLWLRWQPNELLRPMVQLHGDDASGTELAGYQAAIHIALTALLRAAGYQVTEQDEGWLVVSRRLPDAA